MSWEDASSTCLDLADRVTTTRISIDSEGSHPGDVVYPGNILGYVGNTGNAQGTPPHLHYGVYDPVRGAVNPWPLLDSL